MLRAQGESSCPWISGAGGGGPLCSRSILVANAVARSTNAGCVELAAAGGPGNSRVSGTLSLVSDRPACAHDPLRGRSCALRCGGRRRNGVRRRCGPCLLATGAGWAARRRGRGRQCPQRRPSIAPRAPEGPRTKCFPFHWPGVFGRSDCRDRCGCGGVHRFRPRDPLHSTPERRAAIGVSLIVSGLAMMFYRRGPVAEAPQPRAELSDEDVRLLESGEVPALVGFAVVDQVAVGVFDPSSR